MKIAAILFALSEITALALWYFHILPTIGVSCVVLGGLAAGLVFGNLDNPGKPLQSIEPPRRIIPSGHGSDVPMGGQSNSALLALMKTIEQRIAISNSEEIYPTTDREHMRRQGRGPFKTFKERTDEIYDLPTATYPMEMEV